MKYLLASNISGNKITRFCACSSNYVPQTRVLPFKEKLCKKGHLNICVSSKSDNSTSVVDNVKMWPDIGLKTSKSQIIRTKSDNDIKVILCPKFPHTFDDKIELSLGTSNMKVSESTHLRIKDKSSSKIDQDLNSCDTSFVERRVCETVKELIKDIVVPEVPLRNNLSSSDVEWVTLESLFKEITSLTKIEGHSSDTVNEVEVRCETLEPSKDFKLLIKNINEVQSVCISCENNMLGIQQNNIPNQLDVSDYTNKDVKISESIYTTYEHPNKIAEEVKTKLLDDIRHTYNISVETSLENIIIKEPDLNVKKLKNIRKCLRNLGQTALEQTECNCAFAKGQKYDECNSYLKKNKKYYSYENSIDDIKQSYSSGMNEIKKCMIAISNMQKEEFQSNDNKIKIQARNMIDYLKPIKNRKICKKHK